MNEIRKSRNKELFISIACEIIEEEGLEAATIRNIASKAGYNSATLYSYFQNLSHLLLCAHMKFEDDIMKVMKEELDNSEISYYDIWPKMYIIMARYYLAHPNAFECSYVYKNEIGKEEEIRLLREQTSQFQKFIFECLAAISNEKHVTFEDVMKVNKSCIALLVGTLLMVLRERVNDDIEEILAELDKDIRLIIGSL